MSQSALQHLGLKEQLENTDGVTQNGPSSRQRQAVRSGWTYHVYTDVLSCNSPNREEMLVIYIPSSNHVVEFLKSIWICFYGPLGVISFC